MSRIVNADRIGPAELDKLMSGEALIVHVRRFIDPPVADDIADRIVAHWSLAAYRNTPELIRVGESHYETHDADGGTNPAALEEYLAQADALMNEIRNTCAPHEPPMDILWRQLDADFGLERARIGDREMFAGIGRVFPQGTELLPHNDRLARDAPDLPLGQELDGQLAANIYLRVPTAGGQLQVWDLHPSDEDLTNWHATGSEYGVDRSLAPAPTVELTPSPGDLALIDATRLHGVAIQQTGSRVGLSCFLGVRRGQSLVCWS